MKKKFSLFISILLLLFLFLVFVTQVSAINNQELQTTSSTPFLTQSLTPENVCLNEILNSKIDSLESQITIQSNAYSSAINRWESNMNTILVIIAIATVILAVLGFSLVRFYLRKAVEDNLKGILKENIEKIYEDELNRIRKEWEPKFTKLYEEYRHIPPTKK
jgi:predicted PurR-regulated permease PerM